MPMSVDELKARVKLRIAEDPGGSPRTRMVEDPTSEDNTYDSEGGAPVELIQHDAGLELTWELELIIDAVCEGMIEMCEEKGLLLDTTVITNGCDISGGGTADTMDVG